MIDGTSKSGKGEIPPTKDVSQATLDYYAAVKAKQKEELLRRFAARQSSDTGPTSDESKTEEAAEPPKKARKPRVKKPPERSAFDIERLRLYEQRMADGVNTPQKSDERQLPPGVKGLNTALFDEARLTLFNSALMNHIRWPWLLWGGPGVGKTYLAAAIYMQWPDRVCWFRYSDFCRYCRQIKNDGTLNLLRADGGYSEFTHDSWWNWISRAGLVVIDDVGTGKADAERDEFLLSLLDYRNDLPLILTSNLSTDAMHSGVMHGFLDERVRSRIFKGTWMHALGGQDLRVQQGTEHAMAHDPERMAR